MKRLKTLQKNAQTTNTTHPLANGRNGQQAQWHSGKRAQHAPSLTTDDEIERHVRSERRTRTQRRSPSAAAAVDNDGEAIPDSGPLLYAQQTTVIFRLVLGEVEGDGPSLVQILGVQNYANKNTSLYTKIPGGCCPIPAVARLRAPALLQLLAVRLSFLL